MEFTNLDDAALEYVMKRAGYDIAKEIITDYFTLDGQGKDDKWFKEQGHNVVTIKNKLEFLYSHSAEKDSVKREYVVGFTASGFPIIDKKPTALLKNFPVTAYSKWLSLSTEQKYLVPKNRWVNTDTSLWERTWAYVVKNPRLAATIT